jgi:D-alanine-D-alanine ligase
VKRLHIGVLYGGRSSEHEVSVASAASVIAHLDRKRYEPVAIKIERDGRWTLPDRPPTSCVAAEVIEQARLQPARAVRPGRQAHLVCCPGEETLLTIERRRHDSSAESETAYVNGLGLDVVFPVLHGPYGEDGTVQGLLELADVPYVGAGVLASAVAMDKGVMKQLFAARGLPTPEWIAIPRREWRADRAGVARRVADRLGFPLFVKPANMGSSIGITKVRNPAALEAAIDYASEFDLKIVVEAAVPHARDIECSVVGNGEPKASLPGEVIPSREFYDYEAKYLDDGSRTEIPADIPQAAADEVRRLAVAAFQAIDCAGMARVDFLLDGQSGDLYVNEINTIPGFTTISMYPKLWIASGLEYPALLDLLVELAMERHAEKQDLRTSVVV